MCVFSFLLLIVLLSEGAQKLHGGSEQERGPPLYMVGDHLSILYI